MQSKNTSRVARYALRVLPVILFIVLSFDLAHAVQPPKKIVKQDISSDSRPVISDENLLAPNEESLHENLDRRFRYSKKFQSELGVFGGNYLGDEWLNTWDVGARYFLHLNNTFAIGVSYYYSPVRVSSGSAFTNSLKTKQTHTVDAELMVSNDCAFRVGHRVIECDMYFTLGVGEMQINRIWKTIGVFGGGMKFYTPWPWLALRVDVNAVLHYTPVPGGDNFNSDMTTNGGISFLFPIKKIEKPEKR